MKALDPETGGTFEVTIAEGDWYTVYCPACGHSNGVWIDAPGHPVPAKPDPYVEKCLRCGKPTEYRLIETLPEFGPEVHP